MRKAGILSVIILCLLSVVKVQAQEKYDIKIKVNGLKDSLIYLANYYGEKQFLTDSSKADPNGVVHFKGDKKLPGGIYLVVLPDKKYFEIIIDKQQQFSLETNMEDFVSGMKIKDSEENTIFYNYLKFISSKSKEVEPLRAEYEAVKNDKEKAEAVRKKINVIDSAVFSYKGKLETDHPDFILSKVFKVTDEVKMPPAPLNPDGTKDSLFMFNYYKAHFFDNIDLTDDRLIRTPVFHPKLDQYFKKLTLQIPDSINKEADHIIAKLKPGSEMFKYVVWWITNTYETSNIMGMDAVFVHMAENYYTKEKAFWADEAQLFKIQDRAKILKPILIGKKVKNLVLKDSLEIPRALYDIKTKYTVLFFWDPDCGHCQKTVPPLKELYDRVKSKGLEIYAVCTEVEKDKWKKFIKEKELTWINVGDFELKNNFRHEFDITTTPQIFLLDENKSIIAKKIEVETLEDILEKKFEETGK